MDVATGDRVTDPEQLVAAIRVAPHLLWAQVQQRLLVHLAEVGRARLQREVQLVGGQRAVLDDGLVDDALPGGVRVLVVQVGVELGRPCAAPPSAVR